MIGYGVLRPSLFTHAFHDRLRGATTISLHSGIVRQLEKKGLIEQLRCRGNTADRTNASGTATLAGTVGVVNLGISDKPMSAEEWKKQHVKEG
jgi:hypothetical protein